MMVLMVRYLMLLPIFIAVVESENFLIETVDEINEPGNDYYQDEYQADYQGRQDRAYSIKQTLFLRLFLCSSQLQGWEEMCKSHRLPGV